jgi:hypothetical protein
MNKNSYAGVLTSPKDNFTAVRDGRRSTPFYYDVDLSTARSAAAGTALSLNVAGNSFYVDANPTDGYALVHFQDTSSDRAASPLYASPGAIFNIPFTQILIENVAQAGKRMRIVYGVDVDFQPGSVSQIALSGSVLDDYVTKSANGQNYMTTTVAAALPTAQIQFMAIRNNGSTQIRVNSCDSYSTSPLTTLDSRLFKMYGMSAATDPFSYNTRTGAILSNRVSGAGASIPVATITQQIYEGYPNILNFNKPIYINPGDGLCVATVNNTGGNIVVNQNINFDVL